MIVLFFNVFKMDTLPECLIHIAYKLRHETLYSKLMKQLKNCRLNTVFIVSLEFLEYGYYEFGEFGGIRTPCVNTSNMHSTPYEILCLIYNNRDMLSNGWSRQYGGVL